MFPPRHAIHAESDGKAVDILICFECGWVNVFFDGKGEDEPEKRISINASAQPVLDKVLTAAKVPLPKKPKE
jgi:hypothetical protein